MVLPFENDNLKIMKTLSRRSFLASRFRNLVAVLAIALTAVLFTSITTIGMGTMESMKMTQQIQKMSKADVDIRNLTEVQYEKLKESGIASELGLRMPIGFLTNTVRHEIELDLENSVQRELTFCQPTHGVEPVKANEIVASDRALEELGAKPEVGAEVIIEFTVHGRDYQLPMVVSGWYESSHDELSIMTVSEAFREEHPEIFEYTYREDAELAGTYWADFMMADRTNMEEQLDEFVESIGGSREIGAPNSIPAVINQETNPGMDSKMMAAFAVLVILFIFCGYLLIYNVFDIAVMQEVRRYGLYRTIGMSKKQVKQLINRQAVWVSCMGIPLGLLIGFFVGKITLPKIMDILSTEYKNIVISVSPNPVIFIAAAILAALTVFISTRKPARMASNISPMEAFRYVETKGKNRKNAKVKRHYRGINLGQMAFANLGRNKRRSVFIVVSLMLSVVMLNTVGTAAGSVDVERQVNEMIRTDFEIAHVDTSSNLKGFIRHDQAVPQEAVQAVQEMPGVTDASLVYKNTLEDLQVTFDYGMKISDIKVFDEQGTEQRAGLDPDGRFVSVGADDYPICNVYGMEKAGLAHLQIAEGEKDFNKLYEKLMEGGSVILGMQADRKTKVLKEYYNYMNVGDTITARINGEEIKSYTVIAKAALTSDDEGFGYSVSSSIDVGIDAPYLYLPQEEMKELYQEPAVMKYTFDVEEGSKDEMRQFLESYIQENPSLTYLSADKARASAESSKTMIYMVGGIIAFIFGITGILNLINMMSTSILARRREFATMQSIGMTKKQLRKLLMLEGCLYAAGAAVLGIVFSVVVDQTLLKMMLSNPSMWYFTYHITILPAVILSMILVVISVLIPRGAMRMFYKGSVVEQLRIAE